MLKIQSELNMYHLLRGITFQIRLLINSHAINALKHLSDTELK